MIVIAPPHQQSEVLLTELSKELLPDDGSGTFFCDRVSRSNSAAASDRIAAALSSQETSSLSL